MGTRGFVRPNQRVLRRNLGHELNLKILLYLLLFAYLAIIYLWSAGAVYFDVGGRNMSGALWMIAWTVLFICVLFWVKPFWLAAIVFTIMVGCVAVWDAGLKPSHDRDWDPNFAKLPEFIIDGDSMTVHNVRNTHYRSLDDYDPKFETRQLRYSDLKGMDVLILYWGSDSVCHPMAIFDFGNTQHLCFSIEVRYRLGEEYEMLRSLYRQNELMYLVCDERDAILRRTKYSENHDCYLYRSQAPLTQIRELLDDYIRETNEIVAQPRWYNVITANCTTSIFRQAKGRISWDPRILFNGKLDEMIYERGNLFQGLPFDELKKKSWINERANNASLEMFSAEIRDRLPGYEPLVEPLVE